MEAAAGAGRASRAVSLASLARSRNRHSASGRSGSCSVSLPRPRNRRIFSASSPPRWVGRWPRWTGGSFPSDGCSKDDFPKEWTLKINGVQCAIYQGESGFEGGITESNTEQGRAATVVFQCYWRDRIKLMTGLLGTVDYIGGQVAR